MLLPIPVQFLLSRLQSAGFTAYAVGGCIRDSLLGTSPKDWDICTSALPCEIKQVFSDEHLVETGMKHGTLTVVLEHIPYEITTYRLDGSYSDHRHPDFVSFVDQISLDLARRDFTINAMACNAQGEIMDLYRGQDDLDRHVIRCVGDPSERFEEDSLRILRALRFASVLDFQIASATEDAIFHLYPALKNIAAERIHAELIRLLTGVGVGRILRRYQDIFAFLIPCLKPTIGYDQQNPHHLYTVWEHSIRAVENILPDPVLRMTMLLHDCGKPLVRTTDEYGIGHYRGHQAASARLASEVLSNLRFDRAQSGRIIRLIEAHDIILSTDKKRLLHLLHQFGEKDLRDLFQIHCADRIATGTRNPSHAVEHCLELNKALDQILSNQPCFTLKDLQINGRDLLSLGFQGKEIGNALNHLLNLVMDGILSNEKNTIMNYILEAKPNIKQ